MTAVLFGLPGWLYALPAALAAGLACAYTALVTVHPAQGRHRTGAPTPPAPAPGRHEGRIRPAYGELGLVPAAGRHESGEHPIVTDQALEAA